MKTRTKNRIPRKKKKQKGKYLESNYGYKVRFDYSTLKKHNGGWSIYIQLIGYENTNEEMP